MNLNSFTGIIFSLAQGSIGLNCSEPITRSNVKSLLLQSHFDDSINPLEQMFKMKVEESSIINYNKKLDKNSDENDKTGSRQSCIGHCAPLLASRDVR